MKGNHHQPATRLQQTERLRQGYLQLAELLIDMNP
jgi:hypothetical protein